MLSHHRRSPARHLLIAAPCLCLPAAANSETLSDALALASTSHSRVHAAGSRAAAANEAITQARARYWPNVAITGEAGLNHPASSPLQVEHNALATAGLVATQPLFDGGRTRSAVEVAKTTYEAEKVAVRRASDTVLLSGIAAYVDVRLNRNLVAANERQIGLLKSVLALTRRQLDAGEATRTDLAQVEAALAGARAKLAQAQSALSSSIAAFEEALLHAPAELQAPPKIDRLIPQNKDQAVALAQSRSPDIIAAALRERAAFHAIEQARAKHMPTVSLQAGYQWSDPPLNDIGSRGGFVVKIVATVPIYSGGSIAAEVRAAQHARDAAQYQADDARAQIRTTTAQAWAQMTASRSGDRSAQLQIASARAALNGIIAERKVGQRTVFDQIVAQEALLAAETARQQSQRNCIVATFQIALLVGTLTVDSLAAAEATPSRAVAPKATSGWVTSVSRSN